MTAREEFVCENFCEYKVVLPGKGEGPSLAGRNKVCQFNLVSRYPLDACPIFGKK